MFDVRNPEACDGAWLFSQENGPSSFTVIIDETLEKQGYSPNSYVKRGRLTLAGWETYSRLQREYRPTVMYVCLKHGRGMGPCCAECAEGATLERVPISLGAGDVAYHVRLLWSKLDYLVESALVAASRETIRLSEYTFRALRDALVALDKARDIAAGEDGQSQEDSVRRKKF